MRGASARSSGEVLVQARRGARVRLLALLAVVGPGLRAGLSDDDPAGITTYSVLGATYGYQLIWVLVLSTVALILFHDLATRVGVVTGQGSIGIIRQRFGVRVAGLALGLLLVANIGTTAAEFAGLAAGCELLGLPRAVSVPLAGTVIAYVVLRGSFHRIEHVLLALGTVFVTYLVAAFLARPDWAAAARGAVVPSVPLDHDAIYLIAATVGTTLAPWGLTFIQSYAVDKRLTVDDLRYERVDVVVGAVLTGLIGVFVIVACAATLHVTDVRVDSAADAAVALEPLVGDFARTLFAVGLIGSAVLAAAILPLSTSYSICEFVGTDAALDDSFSRAKLFYLGYVGTSVLAMALVLVPSVPLVSVLVGTQALNAVLLLPLLVLFRRISRDADVMGEHTAPPALSAAYLATIVLVALCVVGLAVLAL